MRALPVATFTWLWVTSEVGSKAQATATRPFGAIDTDGGVPNAVPSKAVVPMAVAGPHALWAARSAT